MRVGALSETMRDSTKWIQQQMRGGALSDTMSDSTKWIQQQMRGEAWSGVHIHGNMAEKVSETAQGGHSLTQSRTGQTETVEQRHH